MQPGAEGRNIEVSYCQTNIQTMSEQPPASMENVSRDQRDTAFETCTLGPYI